MNTHTKKHIDKTVFKHVFVSLDSNIKLPAALELKKSKLIADLFNKADKMHHIVCASVRRAPVTVQNLYLLSMVCEIGKVTVGRPVILHLDER